MRRRILTLDNKINTNGHEYIDMGEGVGVWATCNVGSTKPTDGGLYFAWADTSSNPTKTYSWATTPYWVSGSFSVTDTKWSKYTSTNSSSSTGVADNKLVLEPEDDAAHVIMGGDWRMPTYIDYKNLYDACNTEWIENYEGSGVNGLIFKLKTDPTKKLFFPAAGYYSTTFGSSKTNENNTGYYWSSSLYSLINGNAYRLYFNSREVAPEYANNRCLGQTIRGILG